jgi:hypothetical protein
VGPSTAVTGDEKARMTPYRSASRSIDASAT